MFDHEIPLNQESRITIVHGPNGVGKSVMLHMLHGFFHNKTGIFESTPFGQFRIDYQDGASVCVYQRRGTGKLTIQFDSGNEDDIETYEVGKREYYDSSDAELVNYRDRPAWYSDLVDKSQIDVIDTFRLIRKERYSEDDETDPIKSAWQIDKEPVEETLSDFEERVKPVISDIEWLERLTLLLGATDNNDIDEDSVLPSIDLRGWISERKETIKRYREDFLENSEIEQYPHVMSLLAMIDFIETVDERILFKVMGLAGGKVEFWSEGEPDEIPLWALSSGEQHLLVMYFRLFFEIQPDTLVIIDEPEISMNVVWQRNFLKDLQRIIELRKFDVLIATHSPQIIHDKWDWMVPLGAKVDD